jgi:hypothetical protein
MRHRLGSIHLAGALALAFTLGACIDAGEEAPNVPIDTGNGGTSGGGAGTTGAAGTSSSAAGTGASGTDGGSAGTNGSASPTGSAGTTGVAGTTGSAGTSGAAGTTGSAGTTGAAGTGSTSNVYPPENPDVAKLCTVPITFMNQFPTTTGGMRFTTAVPDPQATMQQHARTICRFIFRKPEDVKKVTASSLVIDQHGGVAQAGGGRIQFDANYIGGIGGNAAAIAFEINGVLVHESTHLWQYNNGGGALVEAMADYVRFRSGFDKLSRRRPGGNWSDPYTTGGFFIAWVEDKYDKDWGYKINMGMRTPGFSYPNFIMQTFGKTADALWAEYQADISK